MIFDDTFDEQQSFENHRAIRQERKRITLGDRSKFKKTDWDKRALARSELKEGESTGRVMRALGDLYFVQLLNKEILPCNLRGALKKEVTSSKNLVVVGDLVLVKQSSEDQGTIEGVLERTSALFRADNLSRRKRHLLAANVEWALIVSSIIAPPLKTALLDRCIIAAQKGGIKPILVINKIDLAESEKRGDLIELLKQLQTIYTALQIPLVLASAVDRRGLDEIFQLIGTSGAAIAGQSGVGKTSLLNQLTGNSLPVGPVRIKTGKGTHTTTHAQLISLQSGGWIIDTPGVSSFGIWQLEIAELRDYFSEIHQAGQKCRFSSCSHTGEAGCAIPEAIEAGFIAPVRFQSYLTLLDELSQTHLRR